MKKPDIQVTEGKWYPVIGYPYHECCHCALVHRIEYRLHKGELEDRAFIEHQRTAQARKKRGIVVDKGGVRRVTRTANNGKGAASRR